MKLLISLLLFISFLSISSPKDTFHCPMNGWDSKTLQKFKSDNFKVKELSIDQLASDLLGCLAHTNPSIRDGITYSAYSNWLRGELLSKQTQQSLFLRLSSDIVSRVNDEQQVYLPFAVLVFSEVIRADRVSPYLSDRELDASVTITTELLSDIRDYRGFDDSVGWRHMVAHSADVALQLILNKRLTPSQHIKLVKGLFRQIAPDNHSYVFGESKRLVTPLLYSWLSMSYEIDVWQSHIDQLMIYPSNNGWQDAYKSEQGLHKLHNTRFFLLELKKLISSNDIERLKRLEPSVDSALKKLG